MLNLACGRMLKPMEIDLPPFYLTPLCFSENSFSAHELQSRALLVSGTLGRTVMNARKYSRFRLTVALFWRCAGFVLALCWPCADPGPISEDPRGCDAVLAAPVASTTSTVAPCDRPRGLRDLLAGAVWRCGDLAPRH